MEQKNQFTEQSNQQYNQLIETNVPLHDKNWFETGGKAAYFAQPNAPEKFQHALAYAQQNNLPVFVLGQGANVLISDEGFDGLVIRPGQNQIHVVEPDSQHALVHAGAGTTMHDLIEFCLNHHLLGLEEFSGIPGTVGGSVYINLHYYQFLLGQFLISGQIINRHTGALHTVDNTWFKFGYNHSNLHDENHFLLSATFKLKKASDLEIAYARGRRVEIIRHRINRYPHKGTCGSFFRNFHEHEVTAESNGKKMIYVAYYLDKIGIKGQLSVGDAIVSHQHANMIVNRGNATSTDIAQLARTMQQLVSDQFGIIPQPECRLLGFKNWPLFS